MPQVDSSQNRAITAIRNIALENKIAESLHRIGWQLIYRATSREELDRILLLNPGATLIAAEDFLTRENTFGQNIIWVTPTTMQHELDNELRNLNQKSEQSQSPIPPLSGIVSVITTIDAGVGCSTLAINLAYESARIGRKTLLFDFNSTHPSLSRYFNIQRINRTLTPTPFGFTLGEISEHSQFLTLAQAAQDFDHVVIDLGRTLPASEVVSGQRIQESLARWSLDSADYLYLMARGDHHSILNLKEKSEQIQVAIHPTSINYVLISQSTISNKERRSLLESTRTSLLDDSVLLTRDVRSLSKATIEGAPLAVVAPKSPLVREISQLYRTVMKGER